MTAIDKSHTNMKIDAYNKKRGRGTDMVMKARLVTRFVAAHVLTLYCLVLYCDSLNRFLRQKL